MRTPDSPPIVGRAQTRRRATTLPGTLLSFTTVQHPPKGFPDRPRTIGLIELTDGQRVLGPLLATETLTPTIGRIVVPRMRLARVNEQGLRIYEVAYELTVRAMERKVNEQKRFPGYILALTGPSGVGKTTVSVLLTKMLDDFTAKVPIVTNRAPKEGDDGEYEYVSLKEFERLQKNGELVTWARVPSEEEGHFYGYRGSDVAAIWSQGKLPVVATELHLLQGLSNHYGRRSILSFGLLPPGSSKRAMLSALLRRLRIRGRETVREIEERLHSARADLEFFKQSAHLFDHILVNEDLSTVLQTIKGHVLELART
jgi:guanylate kinase